MNNSRVRSFSFFASKLNDPMKKLLMTVCLFGAILLSAQELPQPSPLGSIQQRVGLTDIEIEYSRPQMKGRTIFGELVPYRSLWRTGANKVTRISFSTDVQVNGDPVSKGDYALLTIPGEATWTIILNSETEMWGTGSYSEDNDVLRTEVAALASNRVVESFSMDIRDITGTSCGIGIEWEKTSVVIPVQMDVARQAEMNIAKAIEEEQENWRVFRNSAQYYMNAGNMEEALVLIDRCLELDGSSWYSHWVRAQILHGLGKDDMAKEAAVNALELGEAGAKEKGTEFSYKGMIRSTMRSW
jgi:hypothetical protein